jgi:spore coat protein CotH
MPTPQSTRYLSASENVFLENEVARVDITLDPADFQALLADPESDEYRPATMRWQNSRIDVTVESVGFRPRGGRFTRPATRKSWSIDINDLVPGRNFFGLEKINLNGDHNDPTFLRRRLAHHIMRRMGLPTPRIILWRFISMESSGAFR